MSPFASYPHEEGLDSVIYKLKFPSREGYNFKLHASGYFCHWVLESFFQQGKWFLYYFSNFMAGQCQFYLQLKRAVLYCHLYFTSLFEFHFYFKLDTSFNCIWVVYHKLLKIILS